MRKKYIVRLTKEEREELEQLVNKGTGAAHKRRHAQILLKADISEAGDGWKDQKISAAFDIAHRTVERVRQRLVERGLEGALNRAKQVNRRKPKLDGEQEARLIALSCSEAPEGYARWSLRLLADKMVELNYVDELSQETVRQVLKKQK